MAVRNTRTGGARKRVSGEKPKGAVKTTKKPASTRLLTASQVKRVQEKAAPKAAPKKPTTPTSSEAITSRRPQMNDQYEPAKVGSVRPVPKKATPTEKPAPKTTVKVDPTKKQRPNQMDEVSGNQFKKKTSTGSK